MADMTGKDDAGTRRQRQSPPTDGHGMTRIKQAIPSASPAAVPASPRPRVCASSLTPSSPLDASARAAARHARAVTRLLIERRRPRCSRILDIGCGLGRQAELLARAGHRVVGVDIRRDQAVLARWSAAAARQPRLRFVCGDARALPLAASFHAVLLLYNSLALFHANDDAIALLAEARRVLAPRGLLLIDNVCRTIWREIAAGRYADGISDDGLWQMVWLPARNVFALRYGDQVSPGRPRPRPGEPLYRAWSLDEIDLLCRLSGWVLEPPTPAAPLLVARPG